MDRRSERQIVPKTIVLLAVVLLMSGAIGIVTAQVIEVNGEFQGEMAGYGEKQSEQSHVIQTTGQMTFRGENAQKVTISISSGQHTILDRSSIEIFAEGTQDISFDRRGLPNRVVFRTAEIPSGTTVIVEYRTVFVGGTDSDEISAGTVSVDYETPGGTTDSGSFNSPTDVSTSADNRIKELEVTVSRLQIFRLVGIGGAVVAVLMIVVALLVRKKWKGEYEDCQDTLEELKGTGGNPPASPTSIDDDLEP